MTELSAHKERLYWVDSAKGVLILLVAIGHLAQRGDDLNISCPAIDSVKSVWDIWSVFYMTTFFIISGFWGRYEMGFKDFVVKRAKALLLPLVIFSYFGGVLHELFYEILKHTYNEGALMYPSLVISVDYWFVLSLFIAQIIYWCLCRWFKKESLRWVVSFALYLLGVLSLKVWFLPNFACWKWAVVLTIYIPLGQVVKRWIHSWKLFAMALISYLCVWLVFYYFGFGFPYTTGGMKNLDLVRALPSLLLCISGSIVFLKLCSFIKRARVLELLGRNTLAIYVMHWWIEILSMKVMRSFFSQGVWMSTLATLVTLAVAVFVPCLISELLNRPKLKWILGK